MNLLCVCRWDFPVSDGVRRHIFLPGAEYLALFLPVKTSSVLFSGFWQREYPAGQRGCAVDFNPKPSSGVRAIDSSFSLAQLMPPTRTISMQLHSGGSTGTATALSCACFSALSFHGVSRGNPVLLSVVKRGGEREVLPSPCLGKGDAVGLASCPMERGCLQVIINCSSELLFSWVEGISYLLSCVWFCW